MSCSSDLDALFEVCYVSAYSFRLLMHWELFALKTSLIRGIFSCLFNRLVFALFFRRKWRKTPQRASRILPPKRTPSSSSKPLLSKLMSRFVNRAIERRSSPFRRGFRVSVGPSDCSVVPIPADGTQNNYVAQGWYLRTCFSERNSAYTKFVYWPRSAWQGKRYVWGRVGWNQHTCLIDNNLGGPASHSLREACDASFLNILRRDFRASVGPSDFSVIMIPSGTGPSVFPRIWGIVNRANSQWSACSAYGTCRASVFVGQCLPISKVGFALCELYNMRRVVVDG